MSCYCLWEGGNVWRTCFSAATSLSERGRKTKRGGGVLASPQELYRTLEPGRQLLACVARAPFSQVPAALLSSPLELSRGLTRPGTPLSSTSQPVQQPPSQSARQASPLPSLSTKPGPFVVLHCPVIDALQWGYI